MTDNTIPVTAPEVNTEQSANTGNYSVGTNAGSLRALYDWCQTVGLVYKGGVVAREPGHKEEGYGKGRFVAAQPSGAVFYIDDEGRPTKEFQPQPDEVTKRRIAQVHHELLAERLPLASTNPAINRLKEADPTVVLPPHVASRTIYWYPSTQDPTKVSMAVVRNDFTKDYIREKDLGRGDSKTCIPWLAFDVGVDSWLPGLPNKNVGFKTPLYWRPQDGSMKSKVVVLEGEKAVDSWARRAGNLDDPLQALLVEYTPVCWQGGAQPWSVHRADWSLIDRPDREILLFPDADNESYDNGFHIIRKLLKNCKSLRIIHWKGWNLPPHWDVSDDVPLNRDGKPIFTATTLCPHLSLCEDAFDEEIVSQADLNTGKEKKVRVYKIRPTFVRKFAFVSVGDGDKPELVEIDNPTFRVGVDAFNNRMAHCDNRPGDSAGRKMAQLMKGAGGLMELAGYGLQAGGSPCPLTGKWNMPPRIFVDSRGDKVFNLYSRPPVMEKEPMPNTVASSPNAAALFATYEKWLEGGSFAKRNPAVAKKYGELLVKPLVDGGLVPRNLSTRTISPWRDTTSLRPLLIYMRHLVRHPLQRKVLIQWVCMKLAARSWSEQVTWGPLIVSAMAGTGKTFFNDLFAMLAGWKNVGRVRSSDLASEYTEWLEGKIAVFVEELKEQGNWDLYEKLKPYFDEVVTVHRKYASRYDLESMASLMSTSNHPTSALRLPPQGDDRRIFLLHAAEEKAPSDPKMVAHAWKYFGDGGPTPPQAIEAKSWFWTGIRRAARMNISEALWWTRRYGDRLQTKEVWPCILDVPGSRLPRRSEDGSPLKGVMWKAFYQDAPDTEAKRVMTESSRHKNVEWMTELLSEATNPDEEEEVRDQVDHVVFQDLEEYSTEKLMKLTADRLRAILLDKGFVAVFRKPLSTDKNARLGFHKLWREGRESSETLKGSVYVRLSQYSEEEIETLKLSDIKPHIKLFSKRWRIATKMAVDLPF